MTVMEIYAGSDGDATKGLYRELCQHGAAGELAMNLFRCQKNSARAKQYRGGIRGQGSFTSMAYDRKNWAIGNLVEILRQHAASLDVPWGWQPDPATPGFEWVLYIDLRMGQVSFHASHRGHGPDYPQAWDGAVNASVGRIIRYCESILQTQQLGARVEPSDPPAEDITEAPS